MGEPSNSPLYISVDLKKYRIRIYKATLHMLGDPSHIQLLINPANHIVAIKSVDHDVSWEQTHKVSRQIMKSDNSIEIYSRTFITKMIEVAEGMDPGYSYKMSGEYVAAENMAVFSMKTLTKITV